MADTEYTTLIRKANMLKEKGAISEAAVEFEKAAEVARKKNENGLIIIALNSAANTHRAVRELDAAEANLRKIIGLKPNYIHAHTDLADLLFEEEKFRDARVSLETALKIKNDDHDALEMLARYHFCRNRLDEAHELYKKMAESDRGKYDALCSLAKIHLKRNEYEKAANLLRKAMNLEPKNKEAYRIGAASLIKQKNFKKAIEKLETLSKGSLNKWIVGYLLKSYAHRGMGDSPAAEREYKHAIALFERKYEMNPESAARILIELIGVERYLGKNSFQRYALEKKLIDKEDINRYSKYALTM